MFFFKKILEKSLFEFQPHDRHGHDGMTENDVCPALARNLGPSCISLFDQRRAQLHTFRGKVDKVDEATKTPNVKGKLCIPNNH